MSGSRGPTPGPGSRPGVVPSPCISVCRIDEASGWCVGCLRTLDEIAAWSRLDDPAKLRIWRLLAPRRVALPPQPGPAI